LTSFCVTFWLSWTAGSSLGACSRAGARQQLPIPTIFLLLLLSEFPPVSAPGVWIGPCACQRSCRREL
jgi:hypothetical protein